MGMFDDSYDPTDPNQQTVPYKRPGADMFSDIGYMSPQQKDLQAFQMQQQYIQRQLAQQQQMLELQSMSQNMGAQTAGLAAGFSYPAYLAQQNNNGGIQNRGLTSALSQLMGRFQGGGQPGGNPMGMGLNGMTPPPPNQIDPSMLIAKRMQEAQASGKTPADGKLQASQDLFQLSQARNDPSLAQMAARLQDQAYQEKAANENKSSITAKNQADAAKTNFEVTKEKAQLANPQGDIHGTDGEGNQVTYQRTYDENGTYKGLQLVTKGKPIQYTVPETPGDRSKDVQDFRTLVNNSVGTNQLIDALSTNLQKGAATGWPSEVVEGLSNVIGGLGQLGQPDMSKEAVDELNKHTGDFTNWANQTHLASSQWAQLTMSLASTYAEGGRISNKEIMTAEHTLGEAIANPKIAANVLNDVKQRVGAAVDRQHDLLSQSGMPKSAQQVIDNFHNYYKQKSGVQDSDGWQDLGNGVRIRLKQ